MLYERLYPITYLCILLVYSIPICLYMHIYKLYARLYLCICTSKTDKYVTVRFIFKNRNYPEVSVKYSKCKDKKT